MSKTPLTDELFDEATDAYGTVTPFGQNQLVNQLELWELRIAELERQLEGANRCAVILEERKLAEAQTNCHQKQTSGDKLSARCEACGKFVKLDDPKTVVNFTPDSEYTVESTVFLCGDCARGGIQ